MQVHIIGRWGHPPKLTQMFCGPNFEAALDVIYLATSWKSKEHTKLWGFSGEVNYAVTLGQCWDPK